MGRPTRGKTAANRLRRTDTWLARNPGWVPADRRPVVIDLGFGAEPTTTLELAARLACFGPDVVGIEIDRSRVEHARARVGPAGTVRFEVGGFELGPVTGPVDVIRAMNVLRQYDEADHAPAIARLCSRLAPHGVLLEGTCSPDGSRSAFAVYDSAGTRRSLVLCPGRGTPAGVRAVLPKDLIHHCGPGTRLAVFFEQWERLDAEARRLRQPRMAWAAAGLRAHGYPVDPAPATLRRGALTIRGRLVG